MFFNFGRILPSPLGSEFCGFELRGLFFKRLLRLGNAELEFERARIKCGKAAIEAEQSVNRNRVSEERFVAALNFGRTPRTPRLEIALLGLNAPFGRFKCMARSENAALCGFLALVAHI